MTNEKLNYVTKNELANSLGVSLSTINRKLKEIPHIKWGTSDKSRVLFEVSKINEYLRGPSPSKESGGVNL